jgi:hypothetical protein
MNPIASRPVVLPFAAPFCAVGALALTRLLAARGRLSGSGAGYSSRTPTAFSAPEDRSA